LAGWFEVTEPEGVPLTKGRREMSKMKEVAKVRKRMERECPAMVKTGGKEVPQSSKWYYLEYPKPQLHDAGAIERRTVSFSTPIFSGPR
jgi:hypothetical protein